MQGSSDFWNRVTKAGRYECWLWTGSVNKHGYGTLKFRNSYVYAHRLAWILTNGEITKSTLVVMHKCDVPLCCNPSHLLLGTVADNNADMIAKGRANYTKPKGFASPNARMTPTQVDEIKRLYRNGLSQGQIAKQFEIGQTTVSKIVLGKTYGG